MPSGGSWSIGMDQSLRAAGIAGLGTPLPCDHALVSSISFQLLAMAKARRTRTSLNGSWSMLHAVMPPKTTM